MKSMGLIWYDLIPHMICFAVWMCIIEGICLRLHKSAKWGPKNGQNLQTTPESKSTGLIQYDLKAHTTTLYEESILYKRHGWHSKIREKGSWGPKKGSKLQNDPMYGFFRSSYPCVPIFRSLASLVWAWTPPPSLVGGNWTIP